MSYDSPRSAMRLGSARQRGSAPTAAVTAATQSQTPAAPPAPPVFIKSAYDAKGGKMTAQDWRKTANTAVQTHGYDIKALTQSHRELLGAGQIKRSRVRFTGYQWNHEHGKEAAS